MNNRMISRAQIAWVISSLACIAAIAVAWQAVRFCQGDIGAPGIDQFIAVLHESFGEPSTTVSGIGGIIQAGLAWLSQAYYYMGGIGVWIGLALFVSSLGAATARIVEVGFAQYMAECKSAQEEAARMAKIEAARERRREFRRKRREKLHPKSSFGFGTLLLGFLIGKLF